MKTPFSREVLFAADAKKKNLLASLSLLMKNETKRKLFFCGEIFFCFVWPSWYCSPVRWMTVGHMAATVVLSLSLFIIDV